MRYLMPLGSLTAYYMVLIQENSSAAIKLLCLSPLLKVLLLFAAG